MGIQHKMKSFKRWGIFLTGIIIIGLSFVIASVSSEHLTSDGDLLFSTLVLSFFIACPVFLLYVLIAKLFRKKTKLVNQSLEFKHESLDTQRLEIKKESTDIQKDENLFSNSGQLNERYLNTWISNKQELLEAKFPGKFNDKLFLPDSSFYVRYIHGSDPVDELHSMAAYIFDWLGIDPKGCVINFYDPEQIENLGADTAGFYTKIENQEYIYVNNKYINEPMSVAAILAHEMMHLYLFRKDLRIEETNENELLTDLATIKTGLSVLIINGMHYENQWYMTIIAALFGRLYWSSSKKGFGYFNPGQYGKIAREDWGKRGIKIKDIIGFIGPTSRHFISLIPFFRTKPTTYIRFLEKQELKKNLILGGIVTVILGIFFGYSFFFSVDTEKLKAEIDICKTGLTTIEQTIKQNNSQLTSMKNTLDSLESIGNYQQYNEMVGSFNSLLNEEKNIESNYEPKLKSCNDKVDKYNQNK